MTGPNPPVTPTHTPVAGLLVPTPLVARIVAALRWQYPTVTEGKTDPQAVRAAMKAWISSVLEMHEASQAAQQGEAALTELRATVAQQEVEAAAAARRAADSIVESPTAPTA